MRFEYCTLFDIAVLTCVYYVGDKEYKLRALVCTIMLKK